jgi:hypothetical protein
LFDHSCGSDKQRIDVINAENMLKGYGSKQSKLQDAKIEQELGCLGPYKGTLSVGDVQIFIFKPGDGGPFNFSSAEREAKRITSC